MGWTLAPTPAPGVMRAGLARDGFRDMIDRFIILGASGDLTRRYLIPALARLEAANRLPEGMRVVGVARRDLDADGFRRQMGEALDRHGEDLDVRTRQAFLRRLDYREAEATSHEEIGRALGKLENPVIAHLALPPGVFGPAIEALRAVGLPEGSRLVVEKPFGRGLDHARELNRLLHQTLPEDSVFRMDHFLGKQTIQNVLGLRFANRVFEPVWNAQHVERVEIVWDEARTVAGRAGYYDGTGALEDMIQNHLLQLLCLVGMEVPRCLDAHDFRNRKVDLLRAVRRLDRDEVARATVRARYAAGRLGERAVPAYVDEEGVDPGRETETFAAVTLGIDNWRWAGVPFVLRSGKALARERREIGVHFRPVPCWPFEPAAAPRTNALRLQLSPDRLALDVNINGPGDPFDLEPIELEHVLTAQDLPAYGRLLLDVLAGDPILSIRADEAEEAWRIIEPIREAWRAGAVPLRAYPAGSGGPAVDGAAASPPAPSGGASAPPRPSRS
jgi:glucose-6-phosphate 1-dehydrogenase